MFSLKYYYYRYYGEFLGCIKYHALIHDEQCPVADLDELVQKMFMRPGLTACSKCNRVKRNAFKP